MKHKWIIGVIIIIVICAIIAFSSTQVIENNDDGNTTNSSGVILKIIADGGWNADITDGNGYDTLYNEGNATYNLNGNSSISVTVVKESNDNGIIEAQLIKDGKIMSSQSTTEPLGTVTVKMT